MNNRNKQRPASIAAIHGMKSILIAMAIFLARNVYSSDILYVSPNVLLKSSTNSLVIFEKQCQSNSITPEVVSLEYSGNRIKSVKTRFPKTVKLEDLLELLSKDFEPIKPKRFGQDINRTTMYVWRDENKKFTAIICYDEDEDGKVVMLLHSIAKPTTSN